ncbi:helix-turn-helix transcriptional regulator [Croceicoccus sp. 1NDH52]|nr:helix-turn-helix transcriptional regulator [Croceicoccus gelatinilyticus]
MKLTSASVPVVENGVVRYTVFPNALRDLRRKKGYDTLQAFVNDTNIEVNYTRLAKIERGQVYPRADEIRSISSALGVPVSKIFIDTTDPQFDREAWAHSHIEASLLYVGGNREDMRLAAAMRIRRKELGLSTTNLGKFKLPAATASRIENAERPFSRWPDKVKNAVRRVFGASSMLDVSKAVNAYERDGKLAEMMYELFSPASISERNSRALLNLLTSLDDKKLADLQKKVEGQLRAGKGLSVESGEVDIDRLPVVDEIDVLQSGASISVYQAKTRDGVSQLEATSEKAKRDNAKSNGLVIRVDEAILGMGIVPGSLVHFEELERSAVKDGMILALINGDKVRIVGARAMGRGFTLQQTSPEWKGTLGQVEGKIAVMTKMEVKF